MDILTSIFGSSGYLPHGYCFTWTPGLLWSMVGADAVIAAAYFSIPLAMMSFVRRRGASSMNLVAWLFIAFIFSCGITHVMDIWTIWYPDYGLQALTKTISAVVSLVTAVALWPLIPKALKIPTVDELQTVIRRLETEISKRRSVEDRLVDMQQSLAVSLGSIGAGFIATDRAGLITRMNAVAEQVTGWTQADALGVHLWAVFHRQDRPLDYLSTNPVDLMIAAGTTVDTATHVDVLARDASRTALEIKGALTHAEDGSVRGLAIVFRDMTEHQHAEVARLKTQELEAENVRIQVASRLKSQFLANMSHELRTPLNAVIGFADLLQSGMVPPDSAQQKEFAGHIGSSGRHLLRLINDVLDLSKVESGMFHFFPEKVDLSQLVQGVVDELQPVINDKRMQVSVAIDPALAPVVDPVRLKQALYNYLSNAI
ncbi:MAG: PAS domain S-box protein, partial [Herminiimonas sp.]|nr:PAS domain S-box protein [Herminiimonas sp.]